MILDKDYGINMNHKKIRRIKNQYELITKIRMKSKYRAVFKRVQDSCTCTNILDRKFSPKLPYTAFSTDVTYLNYGKSKIAYLSTILDLGSKEIVAYNLSEKNNLDLALNTIAVMEKTLPLSRMKKAIFHSDQGFQYTHPIFIKRLKDLNMIQSMSRKGNCLDNAPIESFFGHLKDEMEYSDCDIFMQLRQKVDQYINYYNNNRYQWNLKKMTPREYKLHLLSA